MPNNIDNLDNLFNHVWDSYVITEVAHIRDSCSNVLTPKTGAQLEQVRENVLNEFLLYCDDTQCHMKAHARSADVSNSDVNIMDHHKVASAMLAALLTGENSKLVPRPILGGWVFQKTACRPIG